MSSELPDILLARYTTTVITLLQNQEFKPEALVSSGDLNATFYDEGLLAGPFTLLIPTQARILHLDPRYFDHFGQLFKMRLSLSISIFNIIQSLQVYASLVNDVNTDTTRDQLIDSSSTSALRKRANHNNRKGHHNSNKTPSNPANTYSYNDYNDGIHLAIAPSCGFIAANAWAGDINAGIDWRRIQTVVSPSSPRKLISYATSGSTTDKEIWPSRKWALSRFYANNTDLRLDPTTTLYAGYFVISGLWVQMAITCRGQESALCAFFKTYTRMQEPLADQYNLAVWKGLRDMHQASSSGNTALGQADAERINFAFVDTSRFFSAVDESYAKFGYVSNRHCLEGVRSSIDDECEDPERTVYYMGAHPSVQTHRILAEYVANVLRKCQIGHKQAYTSLYNHGNGSMGSIGDYIPGYLSGGHLFILASVLVALLAYRPFIRASRRGGLGRTVANQKGISASQKAVILIESPICVKESAIRQPINSQIGTPSITLDLKVLLEAKFSSMAISTGRDPPKTMEMQCAG
ncbi:15319_t:CDS:10, partial [Acaulospora colombiana]